MKHAENAWSVVTWSNTHGERIELNEWRGVVVTAINWPLVTAEQGVTADQFGSKGIPRNRLSLFSRASAKSQSKAHEAEAQARNTIHMN